MGIEVAQGLRSHGHRVEIVSCDSMGVYRRLDIAADKPTASERAAVPHHLFDVVEAHETFTAVRYRELAREAIDEIHARGGVPMLVGGSGLYFRAVVDELEFAPTDPEVRARLEASDPGQLLERLREADPATAERLDLRNPRRIVRSAEILELSGRPPSELRESWERFEGPYDLTVAGLTWDRPTLYRRAAERVHAELEAGLAEEVRHALAGGISRTAAQALGVKEIVEHVEGRMSLEDARERLERNTKNFVRRQLSWFRGDPRVVWVDVSVLGWEGAAGEILGRFRSALESSPLDG